MDKSAFFFSFLFQIVSYDPRQPRLHLVEAVVMNELDELFVLSIFKASSPFLFRFHEISFLHILSAFFVYDIAPESGKRQRP